ncbi:MAG: hypothetical protein JNG86_23420 [Verrucomicrobiaceae bacterium]|nr:hypothetical protein [Verrucomicrobiaceae bacterium]
MPRNLFVDQSMRPDPRSLAAFDLCVLNLQAEFDFEPGHALGNRFLALLNVAEFRPSTFQASLAAKRGLKSTARAANDVFVTNPADPNWLAWAVNGTADAAAKRGFDGFVIGIGAQPVNQAWQVAALEMAQVLKKRYPDKQVLLDAHLDLGTQAAGVADGILAIGVHTRRGANGVAELNTLAEAKRSVTLLRQAHAAGLRLFGVEFASRHDHATIREAAGRLQSMGVLPFVTTPEMNGVNLGPLREMTRRVLVLHGWDAKHVGEAAPPAQDTITARCLHAPLEWLGCQVEYLALTTASSLPAADDYRGVVLDAGLVLSPAQQTQLSKWTRALQAKKVPLLITGMPWTESDALQEMRAHLGLAGSCRLAPKLVKTSISRIDSAATSPGAKITARSLGFLDLHAPEDARIVLAARGQDTLGTEHRFDQVFHAAWGGAWIEPAALSAGAQVDVFQFISQWLGKTDIVPAIDTTTRDGRRVFFSHISGEGFTKPSALPGFALCAEVMRERVLGRYFLPFTVAVCEADLRGWLPGQNPAESPRYELMARGIFEMPNIAAASNSFSVPSRWDAGEQIASPLNEHAISNRLDMEREVAGSMNYIHRQLLPAGKSVSLMLWPAFAPPTPEALAFCASMGVQSLTPTRQGSQMSPGSTGQGQFAIGMQHGGNIEVFATAKSTAVGKADAAIQLAHFQASEKSLRTAPVAVSASFLDAQNPQPLASLEKLLDWCQTQPLRAMPAALYAASVRDAIETRVIRMGDRHWIVLNEGHARTLRLPVEAGVPDLARCRGISGYKVHDGQLYIHTLGRPRCEIVLVDDSTPATALHLVESSAHIEFLELASRRATFTVHDWRPVELVLGGFEPRGQCAYNENGRPYTANADEHGIVRLDLSRSATVTLQSLPPAAATASN